MVRHEEVCEQNGLGSARNEESTIVKKAYICATYRVNVWYKVICIYDNFYACKR